MTIRFATGFRCNSRPRFTTGQLSFRLPCLGGALVAGARPVDRGADYCWSKAADYARLALATSDEDERSFFCLMRDNWIIAANDFLMLEKGARQDAGHANETPSQPSGPSVR